jgi:biopolymer transport protein ExbB
MIALENLSLSWAAIAVYSGLGLLSFMAITVSFLKLIQFARLGVGRHRRAEEIINTWLGGRPEEAFAQAAKRETVIARVLQAAFTGLRSRPNEKGFAEELARQTALLELSAISERMRMLEGVVQMAPMLGLLGTVIGMIEAFGTLSATQGAVDPSLLAEGIWIALTTTAVGLSIALVAFVITTMLQGRIDRERRAIEALVSMAINGRVGEPGSGSGRGDQSPRR